MHACMSCDLCLVSQTQSKILPLTLYYIYNIICMYIQRRKQNLCMSRPVDQSGPLPRHIFSLLLSLSLSNIYVRNIAWVAGKLFQPFYKLTVLIMYVSVCIDIQSDTLFLFFYLFLIQKIFQFSLLIIQIFFYFLCVTIL